MMRLCSCGPIAAAVSFAVLVPAVAWGQAIPAPPGGPAAPPGAAQPPQPGTTYVPMPATYGPPPSANGTIGGGNATESSAHPVTGDKEDSFDLGSHAGSGGAAHGDENGPIFVVGGGGGGGGGATYSGTELPQSHLVRRGDTLWEITDYYTKNPYEWPRIWSYNPQIKNPNWIYPGDEVRLKAGGPFEAPNATPENPTPLPYAQSQLSLTDRRRRVPNDTIFLRDQGWISDESDEVWGGVTGAAEDKMYLTELDEVYLRIEPGHDVRIGQELTIFRPVHPSAAVGAIVQIVGTARIDQWNSRDRVARAQVTESLEVVERGAKVGPLARRFEIVPPRRNEAEVQAHVLASVHPNQLFGQNQVVFIDKGESSGLKPGNRLFIVRRGDPWRRSLVAAIAGYRVSPDDARPMPPMENTPGSRRDDRNYPDEVSGELRVVAVKKESAACVVTQSSLEIEAYDVAVLRRGY
jgi:hypothetical protein